MSTKLFEEAIADAKHLREVAEQNAKKAIVEAVTPKIKEFIEQQLTGDRSALSDTNDFIISALNESEDEEDVILPVNKNGNKPAKKMEEDAEVELSESALASLVSLLGKNNLSESDALSSAFNRLSESEQNDLLEMVKGMEEPKTGSKIGVKPAPAKETKHTKMPVKASGEEKMRKSMEEMYELDLDALNEDAIRIDFGEDVKLDRENPYTVEVMDSEEAEGEDITLEPVEEPEAEEPPEGEEEEEEVPPADEAMVFELDENLLRRELLRLREAKQAKKPKTEMKHKGKKSDPAAAFGGGAAMDEIVMNKLSKLKEAYENEIRKNRDLQTQLNEYRNGIETLREQLSELNLFNAKLLYVNKLIQDKEVTSTQRRAVVEALDGAKNLREAKLIFKSLSESLDRGNSASLNESARRLSPGQSSRPTTSGGSTRLDESKELDRWSVLAGLK